MRIPDVVEQVIADFDRRNTPFDTQMVQAALGNVRGKIIDSAAHRDAWAELVVFCLQEEQEDRLPFYTYFGPMSSGESKDGEVVYHPDIRELTLEIVEHWEHRATSLVHPVLVARYADAVWDLKRAAVNRKPDPKFGRLAVESYRAAVANGHHPDDHDDVLALSRALKIAMFLNDAGTINELKAAILDRFDVEVGKDGWWHHLYETLTANKKVGLTDAEMQRLIAGLEVLLSSALSPSTLDPHAAARLSERLVPYYRKQGDAQSVKRISSAVSQAFETIANNGSRMQATSWLQTAMEHARRAGDDDRVNELRIAREEAIKASNTEMQQFSWTHEVKRTDVEELIEYLIHPENASQSLYNVAAYFTAPKSRLEEMLAEQREAAPLMSLMTVEIVADDHVSARIGGVDDDPDGRLFRVADLDRQTTALWLNNALEAIVDRHQLSEGEIAAFASRSGLFSEPSLIAAGVRAWIDGDYVKCLFVLVPQIEDAFRNMARKLGSAVTKEKRGQQGWEVSVNLGDLLSMDKVKAELGADLHFYFRANFADGRGLNLRNVVAHGLASRDTASYWVCDLLVHSLLVIGAYADVRQYLAGLGGGEDAREEAGAEVQGAVPEEPKLPKVLPKRKAQQAMSARRLLSDQPEEEA